MYYVCAVSVESRRHQIGITKHVDAGNGSVHMGPLEEQQPGLLSTEPSLQAQLLCVLMSWPLQVQELTVVPSGGL